MPKRRKIGGIIMEKQEVQETVETVDNPVETKKEVKAEKTFTRACNSLCHAG